MKTLVRITLAVLVTLASMASLLTPAHAAGPLRVMIVGDSITQGFHQDYTWRYRLDKEFIRQGVPVDFVGSHNQPWVAAGFTSSRYADPAFDQDHFARVGAQLEWMRRQIHDEVAQAQPDLIILAAGVNDILYDASAAEVNNRLRDWIANARSAKPNVRILLSPVLHIDRANKPNANAVIDQYDATLHPTALALSTPESPINVANTTAGWNPQDPRYAIDGIHPAPTGETLIAHRIAQALNTLKVLPQAPRIFRVLPWTRTSKPAVRMSGSRVVVTWDAQSVSQTTVYTHRAGYSGYHKFYGGRASFSVARHATYTFRVQLRRSRLTGPYGAATTFRTP